MINQSQSKFPWSCGRKPILTFMWHLMALWIVTMVIIRSKSVARGWGSHILTLKFYYKTTVTETVWYWHKDRHIDLQSRAEILACISKWSWQVCGDILWRRKVSDIHEQRMKSDSHWIVYVIITRNSQKLIQNETNT